MKNISLEDFYAELLENKKSKLYMELSKPPDPVGYWVIGADEMGMYGYHMPVYSKPTDEQISNHYKLLGWTFTEKYI